MALPQKHFKRGSTKPELPEDGVPRFFSMAFCPFSHRVRLMLAAKHIEHHKIYVDLIEKPEWYKDFSPLGKVPALQLTGVKDQPTLVESLIIAERKMPYRTSRMPWMFLKWSWAKEERPTLPASTLESWTT
uniref:Glutathione S-transferase omega class n=1 Tax=Drosophila melanogaster TaxID=7227 RepID=D1KS73_DROME|nr:glutathione S-transferase omega class [Drosophila melanogaster]